MISLMADLGTQGGLLLSLEVTERNRIPPSDFIDFSKSYWYFSNVCGSISHADNIAAGGGRT